jgi:hypothetical protein
MSSISDLAGVSTSQAGYAAAGSVPAGDLAYAEASTVVPAPPAAALPEEEVVVTATRLSDPPLAALDPSFYAPAPSLGEIVAAATVGVALLEPTPVGEIIVAASSIQNLASDLPLPVKFGPVAPGPLPATLANTFRGGSYVQTEVKEATRLYRVYGGRAGPIGSFWSRTPPAGPLQSRIDLALNPQWGNTASGVTRIDVPRGTTIFEGAAAPQGWLVGGGNQVVIPNVDPGWVIP